MECCGRSSLDGIEPLFDPLDTHIEPVQPPVHACNCHPFTNQGFLAYNPAMGYSLINM